MLFICSTFTKSSFPSTFNDFFKTIKKAHRYETILTSKKSYYLPKARTNYGKFNFQFMRSAVLKFGIPFLKILNQRIVLVSKSS